MIIHTGSPAQATGHGVDLPASESDVPEDNTHTNAESLPNHANSESNDSFWGMAMQHVDMVADDETDCEPVMAPTIIGHCIVLSQLFDFADPHWVHLFENSARQGFEEELELYELLDLDADGEEEADINLDDSTGDILIG